jgi:hypothetical protein
MSHFYLNIWLPKPIFNMVALCHHGATPFIPSLYHYAGLRRNQLSTSEKTSSTTIEEI